MAAGRTIGLLPWNPDADVDPTRPAYRHTSMGPRYSAGYRTTQLSQRANSRRATKQRCCSTQP